MSYKHLAKEVLETINKTINDDIINSQILEVSKLIRLSDKNNKLVCIFGNGGSAADAQHFSGELVCTYKKNERKP